MDGVVFLTILFMLGICAIPVALIMRDRYNAEEAEWMKSKKPNNFTADKKIGSALWVDTSCRKWAIPDRMPDSTYYVTAATKLYEYDDIVSYSLIEDNKTITKGGASIGRAVVGGVLFGGVGAVIGGTTGSKTSETKCNTRQIKITLRNADKPAVYITFVKGGSTVRNTDPQDVLSMLDIMTKAPDPKPVSSTDEIKKYKELLDIGAITQAEFDEKKKQLLNNKE